MGVGVQRDPQWLRPLLATEFYLDCDKHYCQCVRFCTDCMGTTALCDKCINNAAHQGHQILRVYRVSRCTALLAKDVESLLDTSGIHRFLCNNGRFLFLKSRKRDGNDHTNHKAASLNCVTCGWGINNDSKFCSLGCKFGATPRTTTPTVLKIKINQSTSCKKVDQKSSRKSRRKGIPFRAPLF